MNNYERLKDMTNYEYIKSASMDELIQWLDKVFGNIYCDVPWNDWFDFNYCNKCQTIFTTNKAKLPCSWCEVHGKCKYFPELNSIPDDQQVIKLWLESEYENGLSKSN